MISFDPKNHSSNVSKKFPAGFWERYCSVIFILAIMACALVLTRDLFQDIHFVGHDSATAIDSFLAMSLYWGDGQGLVRWAADMPLGYGYPLFNFYPPLFYWTAVVFYKVLHLICFSINITDIFFFLLSGIFMYLWLKDIFPKEAAFVAAIAYLCAPYRLAQIYIRASHPEAAALVFFPLILWSLGRMGRSEKGAYFFFTVISSACLILTHNCMALFFIPIAFSYVFLLFFTAKRKDGNVLSWRLAGLFLGLLSASFFWIPAFFEKEYVHIERLTMGALDFHRNFIPLDRLLAFSLAPQVMHAGKMYFQIGGMYILFPLIALMMIRRFPSPQRAIVLFIVLLAEMSILLILPMSQCIWEHFSIMKFIQFPWRFLGIATFSTSFIFAGVGSLIPQKWRSLSCATLAVFMLTMSMPYAKPGEAKTFKTIDMKATIASVTHLSGGEYTPIWVKEYSYMKFILMPLKKNIVILDHQKGSSIKHFFIVESSSDNLIFYHSFYFPGWHVLIDGKETPILKDNPYGMILFEFPQGRHVIEIVFKSTPLRMMAVCLSYLGFILAIGGSIFLQYKNEGRVWNSAPTA